MVFIFTLLAILCVLFILVLWDIPTKALAKIKELKSKKQN